MTVGIYKITNKINGHCYIGLSNNIERRWKDHVQKGLNSVKTEDLNKSLYRAFKKYGIDNFNFEILEECNCDQLKDRETYWIKYYNAYENRVHYNETPGGDMSGEKNIKRGEKHGGATMRDCEVKILREAYSKGLRSRDIWREKFSNINYSTFLNIWHGRAYSHIMPEVFKNNPHKGKYTEKDCEIIRERYYKSHLSMKAFSKTKECYVGYGTLWKMINEPHFYQNK